MAEKRLNARIIHKHEVEANWKLSSLVPMQGELIVYDIDDNYSYERFKIGDGVNNVNDLPFANDALRGELVAQINTVNTNIGDVDEKVDAVSTLVGDTSVSEQITDAIVNKADSDHTHDDRYYTETEIDNKLADKSNTSHGHGLMTTSLVVDVANATEGGWELIESSYDGLVGGSCGHVLKSVRTRDTAPEWTLSNYAAGVAFGGGDTKGLITTAYHSPEIKFAGGNGSNPVWYMSVTGKSGEVYNLDDMSTVGENVTGTEYTIDGSTVTAGTNAEIFNDYVSNKATGQDSHAEGTTTTASGHSSHAEGFGTTASGMRSHAEGDGSVASAQAAHAEGMSTTASKFAAHAEGISTVASGAYSHAEGSNTIASSIYQHVQGQYNIEDASGIYAHIVGNGKNDSSTDWMPVRSNAHTVDWKGNGWFAGDVYVGGADQSTGEKLAKQSSLDTLVGDTSVAEQIAAAQMVYVGPDMPTDPNIKVWINTAEEGTGVVPVLPRVSTITLTATSWTGGSSPYSQVVEINTVTTATKIDLQPTVAQMVGLQNDDIALMAENDNGVVTIYSFGGKPSSDMTMQVQLMEVSYV